MARKLPARPNLDHLRRQAKTLLAALHAGEAAAAQTFIEHLPAAKPMTVAEVRAAGFRLADAQSAVARQTGFAGWPSLARHVSELRALEGEWVFEQLEVDGSLMPAAMLAAARILIDGDRFRSEAEDAVHEGVFSIDVEASPAWITIEFVSGPEAGETSPGIYALDGDSLTICLGLVGAPRPSAFVTNAGSGHALERLRRHSAARPAGVTGGTPPEPEPAPVTAPSPGAFDDGMTPLLERLQGVWIPTELVTDGKRMNEDWLPYGSRVMTGTELKVVFGGQTMVHAQVRADESVSPIAVDYLYLAGKSKGRVSEGIMEWVGEEVRFSIAAPGAARPVSFDVPPAQGTFSRWRRR